MHFGTKSYLKSNRNHTAKQTLKPHVFAQNFKGLALKFVSLSVFNHQFYSCVSNSSVIPNLMLSNLN